MATTGSWITAFQRCKLQEQLCNSLQSLAFHKGGQDAIVDWAEKAVAIETKAFQAACDSATDATDISQLLLRIYIREASRLLISEVLQLTQITSQTKQSFVLNPVPEGLRLQLPPSHHEFNSKTIWGWLVPGSRALQHVVLKGAGVAIGRGKEAMWSSVNTASSPRMATSPHRSGTSRGMRELADRNLGFMEVADGRVSRLHCLITSAVGDNDTVAAMLEDCSSNGTFLNGVKLAKGEKVALKEGDRISLVLSVAPLAEQYFTFHSRTPADPEGGEDWPESAHATIYPFPSSSPSGRRTPPRAGAPPGPPSSSWRSTTSRYTTAEQSTLDDLNCQICLGTLSQCVALEPCGHNFCATCLSQHFASQLQGGLQLSCPYRCPMPERVVINSAVRTLVELLQQHATTGSTNRPFADQRPSRTWTTNSSTSISLPPASSLPRGPSTNGGTSASDASEQGSSPRGGLLDTIRHNLEGGVLDAGSDSGMEVSMSSTCPLHDDLLPMDASNLKAKQVEVALQQLKAPDAEIASHQASLEAMARLAWSDDTVRDMVASCSGIPAIVEVMSRHKEHDGIQCNACLALMALVRGEGDVCQANQWHIAKAGAVEAIVRAMTTFQHSAMVQLSALLAFIPLVLENTMMQAHVTQAALPAALAALEEHQEEPDIQTKGLVLLGVLMQGDDVVHDAIRQRQIEVGLPLCVSRALTRFSGDNDDVLWAGLFCLAVLTRKPPGDGSPNVFKQVTLAVARSGILPLLQQCLAAYRTRVAAAVGTEPDEMILSAGEYLISTLQPLVQRQYTQNAVMAASVFACLGVVVALWRYWGNGESSTPPVI